MFNRFECGVSEVKSQLQYKENTAPPPVKDSRCSRMARAKCIWGIIMGCNPSGLQPIAFFYPCDASRLKNFGSLRHRVIHKNHLAPTGVVRRCQKHSLARHARDPGGLQICKHNDLFANQLLRRIIRLNARNDCAFIKPCLLYTSDAADD